MRTAYLLGRPGSWFREVLCLLLLISPAAIAQGNQTRALQTRALQAEFGAGRFYSGKEFGAAFPAMSQTSLSRWEFLPWVDASGPEWIHTYAHPCNLG